MNAGGRGNAGDSLSFGETNTTEHLIRVTSNLAGVKPRRLDGAVLTRDGVKLFLNDYDEYELHIASDASDGIRWKCLSFGMNSKSS